MKSKGFTLIELMVVVAIIALLTSVVVALIGDARDKARVRAFRSEIDQMVKAIELYRSDTGRLPGPNSINSYYQLNENGTVDNTTNFDLADTLANAATPYLQAIPKPPFPGTMRLVVNPPNWMYCDGSIAAPEYLVFVTGYKNIEFFMDWPALVTNGTPSPDYRCFSIK